MFKRTSAKVNILSKSHEAPDGFYGPVIKNIRVLVGKNGVGKSNLIERQLSDFIITKNTDQITFYYSPHGNRRIYKTIINDHIIDISESKSFINLQNHYTQRQSHLDHKISDMINSYDRVSNLSILYALIKLNRYQEILNTDPKCVRIYPLNPTHVINNNTKSKTKNNTNTKIKDFLNSLEIDSPNFILALYFCYTKSKSKSKSKSFNPSREFKKWLTKLNINEWIKQSNQGFIKVDWPEKALVPKVLKDFFIELCQAGLSLSNISAEIVWDHDEQDIYLCKNQLSTGELSYLSYLGRLIYYLEQYKSKEEKFGKFYIFLDEIDFSIYPKLQRYIISDLCAVVDDVFEESSCTVEIVLSTHAPILLSDIHPKNVIYLTRDNISRNTDYFTQEDIIGSPFARNISDILSTAFMIGETHIGEFAKSKLADIVKELYKGDKKINTESINAYIEAIGEPYVKRKLKAKLEEKVNKS